MVRLAHPESRHRAGGPRRPAVNANTGSDDVAGSSAPLLPRTGWDEDW
jgi:hypothetical protein